MTENVIFRLEKGSPLSYQEIDGNFRYIVNPWSNERIYETGMIIYHDFIIDKFILYRANKTTTLGTFNLTEWTPLTNTIVNVVKSTKLALSSYISTEWIDGDVRVGDYVVINNNQVYLLYQNNGSISSDYLLLSESTSTSGINVIKSIQTSLQNFITNEWNSGLLTIGDIIILGNNEVWILFNSNGSSVGQYILLSNVNTYNWASINGKPISTPSQIDLAVSKLHTQGTDILLDQGGTNEITALALKTHISDSTIHHTLAGLVVDHNNLLNKGTNTHVQIDTHIANNNIHFLQSDIDHLSILNKGVKTHTEIDTHLTSGVKTHAEIDIHLNSGIKTHAQIDTHINDTTIHFTQAQIDHINILNRGTNTHSQIDAHIANASIHNLPTAIDHNTILNHGVKTHVQIDAHLNDVTIHFTQSQIDHDNLIGHGFYTHYEIDTHIDDVSIHFLQTDIDHTQLDNIGSNTHVQIDTHIATTNIHFLQTDIDHNNIINKGFYNHTQIDDHINDTNAHYTQTSIDHNNLINKGVKLHSEIDAHIADTSIHQVGTTIDHLNILHIGVNTHVQIDSHIADGTIHFKMSDIVIDPIIIQNSMAVLPGAGLNSVIMKGNCLAAGSNSVSFGLNNTNNGNSSAIIGGESNILDLSAVRSVILGGSAIHGTEADTVYLNKLVSVGADITFGKSRLLNWYGETTNDVETEIFLTDSSRLVLTTDSAIMFRLDALAYNTTDDVSKTWEIRGGIKNDTVGSLSKIGNTMSTFCISEDGVYGAYSTANWTINIVADTATKTLRVRVKGEAGKLTKWSISGLITKG